MGKTDHFTIRATLAVLTGLSPALAMTPALADDSGQTLPDTLVTASRLGQGVTGASTTVITAAEIERSPAQTLPDILSRVPGIQVHGMYGAVNGLDSGIDMRGFGSTYMSNTLILLNGRRLNDNDMSAVDLGAVNRDNIERIEIIRGQAGAVLYGDGAVGGVINIVTKNAVNTPDSVRAEAAIGSLGHREVSATATRRIGDTALSLAGSQITSDGYRDNNGLKQRAVMGEIRQALDGGEVYLNLGADDSRLGYPGSVTRRQYDLGNRRGTTTPYDYGDKQAVNVALGGTADLAPGIELVLDAGLRHKEQQALLATWGSYRDVYYTTASFTPRLNAEHTLFGMPGRLTTGFDLYQTLYDANLSTAAGVSPHTRTHVQQRTMAGYVQETLSVRPDTDISIGGRLEHAAMALTSRYDPTAPQPFGTGAKAPIDDRDLHYAVHLGIEHRLTETLAVFGRVGRSLRLPNIDDWTGTTFALKAQTSRDAEIGLRGGYGRLGWQTSAYLMDLNDELHYDPVRMANLNLEPTRRYGSETSLTLGITDDIRLKGGLAYTKAVFREGALKGNDVPLVATWSGSGGVSWNAWDKYVVVDLDARYVGSRRYDGDEAAGFDRIDPHTLVDLRVGGTVDPVSWSLAVNNLFDETYYDYGYYSTGWETVYSMPGRTVIGRLGVKF